MPAAEIRHMWTQERLQKGEFLLKSVPTDENAGGPDDEASGGGSG